MTVFETLEAIRKYPLEAKRRLVIFVTAIVVAPIFVAWLIWFISTIDDRLVAAPQEQDAVEAGGVEILPPYSD